MKIYSQLIAIAILLYGCKNEPEKNVDTTQNAYEDAYITIEKKFDDALNKLSEIKDFNDFKVGTIDLDSLSVEDAQNLFNDLQSKEKPLNIKFKNSEALVVYDNLLAVFSSDKSKENKIKSMDFSPTNYSYLTKNNSRFSDLLKRKAFGNWAFKDNDSITAVEKKIIIADLEKDVNSLDVIKYLILIDDIVINKSKQKSSAEFYTGTIIMQVKFIDIATKEILARKVFNVENSETISVGADAGEDYIDTIILLDLMTEKVKALNEFFEFQP
uniref:hypothetical protein n=1 Tax=Flavobacterium sp. TaxID=239 RepID=UPI0040499C15